MRIRTLLLATGILLVYFASHYVPQNAQVILLFGNTRVDLHFTAAVAAIVLASVALHWALSLGFWITRIPGKFRDYRKNQAHKKQRQYREEGLRYWLQSNLGQSQYLFAYAGKEEGHNLDLDYLCAAYCALYREDPAPEDATTYLEKINDKTKHLSQKRTLQAKIEQLRGKYHLAMEYLEHIPPAQQTPLSQELREALFVDTQQWQEAEAYLDTLVRKNPKKISAWLIDKVMQQQLIQNRPQSTIQLFEALPQNIRALPHLFGHYAHALHDAQQTDRALDQTLLYLQKNPSLDILYLITHFCSIREEKLHETMGKLRDLQKKEPHNIYIAITLGQLLQHCHHYEQALKSFDHAISLLEKQHPNTQNLATSLTLTCLKQKGYCLEKQKQQAATQTSTS